MCGSNEASRSTGYLEQISLSRLTRSVIIKLNSRECFDRLLAIRRWNKQSFACENLFGFHSKDDDVRVRTQTKSFAFNTLLSLFRHRCCSVPVFTRAMQDTTVYPFIIQLSFIINVIRGRISRCVPRIYIV